MGKSKSVNSVLRSKYTKDDVQCVRGVTKPVGMRFVKYIFGDSFINMVKNKEQRKFDVFVKNTVGDAVFKKFEGAWSDVFNIYRTSGK